MKQFNSIPQIKKTMTLMEQRIFQSLMDTEKWERFLETNKNDMDTQKKTMKEIFKRLRKIQEVKINEIAKEIGCSKDLIYKIIYEKRRPSREMIIAICVVLRLSPGRAWALLHYTQYRELYVLDQRESIILHGLMHKKSLKEINNTLKEQGLAPIAPCKSPGRESRA